MSASVDSDFSALVAAMAARGNVAAADVATLRARIFPDGIVSPTEADALLALNENTHGNHPSWDALFVEALTDHVVWQTRPRGYVDEAGAEALLAAITHDGRVKSRNELELMVNACHWALGCPDSLRVAALDEVRRSVIGGGGVLFGAGRRRANVVDGADVTIVGKLIHAPGGAGSLRVTRAEADLLFDINDATIEAENDPGWRELFVRGVASHLMFPRGEPNLPGLDEAARRERWLAERRGIGGLIGGMAREVTKGGLVQAWHDADLSGGQRRMEDAAEDTAAEARQRGAIDAGEAAWLLDRIGRDGTLHGNETELLRVIADAAAGMHGSLCPLLVKAGVKEAPWMLGESPAVRVARPAA